MEFFNSLAQVAKNQKNFKIWEDQQNDTAAQRKELYKRKNHSPEEIEAAKQLGERIIDVVDIMDNHSENVAENVETATQPIVGLAPIISFFGGGYYFIKKVVQPAEDALWELKKKYFYESEKAQNLAKEITEDIRKTRPNKEEFGEWKFGSKKHINKITNPELKRQAMEIHKDFMKDAKNHFRKIKGGSWALAGLTLASFIGANIYAAKLQVDSSKIARYQARKFLEDPKAFVNYTPEQIEAAKKYIEDHPELKKQKKKEKLKSGMIKSIINLFKDRKAYKESKFANSDESKKVERTLTPEELVQAKKDKEIIQRSVRIINNEAEKYSENMEVAAGIILGSTPILGGFFGWLTGLVMNKTGATNKIVNNIVQKYGSEDAKSAYTRFKELPEGAPGYSVRWKNFVSKLMDDDANYKDAAKSGIGDASANAARKAKTGSIVPKLKKLIASGLSHKWINAKMIGVAGALISTIPASLIALKLQKSAARAGRYTAKRELEKDPRNFIGYTEEDFEEVKEVKGEKKTFAQKVKETALFVPTVLKQYYAYDKYKRTEFKEHQLLTDQLQKSENITSEQLRDAKNLQRKLFNTFEKVDDNSQLYSESMEAATEIAQPFALYAGILTMFSPVIYTAVMFSKGKMSAATILEKIVDKLAKASNFIKGKTFTKYLDDVSKNISHKVGNVDLANKPIGELISGMDFNNDTVAELGGKLIQNLRQKTFDFRNMSERSQVKIIEDIEKSIEKLKEGIDLKNPMVDNLLSVLKYLKSSELSTRTRADMLDCLTIDVNTINTMSPRRIKELTQAIETIHWKLAGGEPAMMKALEEMRKFPELYEDFFKVYNLPSYIFDPKLFIKAQIADVSPEAFKGRFNELNSKIREALSSVDMNFKLKDIPKKFDDFLAELEQMFQKVETNPSRMIEGGQTGVKTSYSKKIANFFTPKAQLAKFKEQVEKMSDNEFQDWIDAKGFSSMNKATMLKIIPNLEKIVDNIPQEHLQKVMSSLWKEFQAHPDEVLKLISTGKIAQIFMTKSLVTAAAAVGITWTALNLLLTWMIESWLADMQLKAGRLGVMKAMESLDDPAYYANIEPMNVAPSGTDNNLIKDVSTQATTYSTTGNLLDKFKKKNA